MSSLTNYSEDAILNWWFRADAETKTPPSAYYVGLISAVADAEAGSVTELTGGVYVRKQTTFDDPAGTGATQNATAVIFPVNTGSSLGTATHFGVWDAVSGGNLLAVAALDSSFEYATNYRPKFAAGDLDLSLT